MRHIRRPGSVAGADEIRSPAPKELSAMSSLPLKTSYWPADTAEPILDTTVGGGLHAAAERAPDLTALTAGQADPARRRHWRYGERLADPGRAAPNLLPLFEPGARE